MGLVVFLILFFTLVGYLLLVPIVLCIDTAKKQCFIQVQGLVTASVEQHDKELLQIKLRVLLFNFYFYPLRKVLRQAQNGILREDRGETLRQAQGNRKKEEVKKRKKGSKKFGIRKIVSILRSFKVKKVLVHIDTGDDVLNAKLFPFFGLLNHYIGTFHVNFEGRNQLVLHMQNRPINIIKSFINK